MTRQRIPDDILSAAHARSKARARAMENGVRLAVQEAHVRAASAQERAGYLNAIVLPARIHDNTAQEAETPDMIYSELLAHVHRRLARQPLPLVDRGRATEQALG